MRNNRPLPATRSSGTLGRMHATMTASADTPLAGASAGSSVKGNPLNLLAGTPLAGISLSGIPLDGVPLDGVPLDGVPLAVIPLAVIGPADTGSSADNPTGAPLGAPRPLPARLPRRAA
jgi:hypothetical protein